MSDTFIARVGFRSYMWVADWELARARALYDAIVAKTDDKFDDYEVQEFFESAWAIETGDEVVHA